jgi:hypothetical protein
MAVYSIARLGQVQVIFRAGFDVGPESLEARQFGWEELPWDEIAFPSVRWALHNWYDTRGCALPAQVLIPQRISLTESEGRS